MTKEALKKLVAKWWRNLDIGGSRSRKLRKSLKSHKAYLRDIEDSKVRFHKYVAQSDAQLKDAFRLRRVGAPDSAEAAVNKAVRLRNKAINLYNYVNDPKIIDDARKSLGAIGTTKGKLKTIRKTRLYTTIPTGGAALTASGIAAARALRDKSKQKVANVPATTMTSVTQTMARLPQMKPPKMPGQLMKPRSLNAGMMRGANIASPKLPKPPMPAVPKGGGAMGAPPPTRAFGGQIKPGRVLS